MVGNVTEQTSTSGAKMVYAYDGADRPKRVIVESYTYKTMSETACQRLSMKAIQLTMSMIPVQA